MVMVSGTARTWSFRRDRYIIFGYIRDKKIYLINKLKIYQKPFLDSYKLINMYLYRKFYKLNYKLELIKIRNFSKEKNVFLRKFFVFLRKKIS